MESQFRPRHNDLAQPVDWVNEMNPNELSNTNRWGSLRSPPTYWLRVGQPTLIAMKGRMNLVANVKFYETASASVINIGEV
jgi:hypothetical protein